MARRGRPRKVDAIPGPDDDENSPGVTPDGSPIDPVAAFGTDTPGAGGDGAGSDGGGSAEPARRRGRKPGSGRKGKAAALDLSGVEAILLSAHTMLAAMTKTPELIISQDEANKLASAINTVQEHYPVHVDPKAMAWLNLAGVAGMIYGPRIFVAVKRKRESPSPKSEAPKSNARSTDIVVPQGLGATGGGMPQETNGEFIVTQ